MSRKRKNKDDEEFRLQQENRELKALNRSLLKQLRKLNKGSRKIDLNDIKPEFPPEPVKEVELEERPDVCPACKRSILKEMDLGIKTIKTCEICQYRSKPKNK